MTLQQGTKLESYEAENIVNRTKKVGLSPVRFLTGNNVREI